MTNSALLRASPQRHRAAEKTGEDTLSPCLCGAATQNQTPATSMKAKGGTFEAPSLYRFALRLLAHVRLFDLRQGRPGSSTLGVRALAIAGRLRLRRGRLRFQQRHLALGQARLEFVVSADDPLHQMMAHHIALIEVHK